MQNNVSAWFTDDKRDREYHLGQFKKTYRSTEVFVGWVKDYIVKSDIVCDMACGVGTNTLYMAKMFPKVNFIGVDVNDMLVKQGNYFICNDFKIDNVKLEQEDWYNIGEEKKNKYNDIISF